MLAATDKLAAAREAADRGALIVSRVPAEIASLWSAA